jgi:hypothetical protein
MSYAGFKYSPTRVHLRFCANRRPYFAADIAVERYAKKHSLDHSATGVQLDPDQRRMPYAVSIESTRSNRTKAESECMLGLVDREER